MQGFISFVVANFLLFYIDKNSYYLKIALIGKSKLYAYCDLTFVKDNKCYMTYVRRYVLEVSIA